LGAFRAKVERRDSTIRSTIRPMAQRSTGNTTGKAGAKGKAPKDAPTALTVVPPERKLTHKQELFVEAFIGQAKGNGTEAARLAGYSGNDETLSAVATENLRKPLIASRVRVRVDQAGATADRVLSEIADIAFAANEGFTQTRFDKDGNVVDARLELKDKLKALELLGKYHKLFTEKHEHGGTLTVAVVYRDRPIDPRADQ
jgi:phage terminase small subunit